jgi:hypothetical protein
MKNSFKLGALALVIAVSISACGGNAAKKATADSLAKADSIAKADSAAKAAADTGKMKMAADTGKMAADTTKK